MNNKEEFLKSIDETMIAKIETYSAEEIIYVQNLRNKLAETQIEEDELKYCLHLLQFLMAKSNNEPPASKLNWIVAIIKVLAILASIIDHFI